MTSSLILYSTAECHLCEQAKALCEQLSLSVETIDIAFDDSLFALYGVRIPVLKRTDSGKELGWPFMLSDLQEFVR